MSRNLYVIPYVDNELEDLAPYEALPLLFKQDLLTTLLKATMICAQPVSSDPD